jgi:hypothetical protein
MDLNIALRGGSLCPRHMASAMLRTQPFREQDSSAAVLDDADDLLRQHNLFDEDVTPHANALAFGTEELNYVGPQANQTTLGKLASGVCK